MSGVHRLLTRKDKKHNVKPTASPPIEPGYLGNVFVSESSKKRDKKEEEKIKLVQSRLQNLGLQKFSIASIEYALEAAAWHADQATQLCLLLEDTYEGLLKPYDPGMKLLGAVNREGVTCYLDALLFAMFARLDGFEAMLYNSLEDAPRKKLAGLLRLWVNMLRTGRLITVDVTQHVQAALAECGWSAAAEIKQQDTSEAFSFITGQLELPLLTLKMDLYHTGKEEPDDDHKFVNERLLEVAVLSQPREGQGHVTLEDCLEHYFNNRVEVKRHLERQRRMTAESLQRTSSVDKAVMSSHIESIELSESPSEETNMSESFASPSTPTGSLRKSTLNKLRPTLSRNRADSIFNQRRVLAENGEPTTISRTTSAPTDEKRKASLSTRTEVLMPAWQFFKLLPWYTDNMPTSDAQVAAHFAQKRPILAICLKRYMMDKDGHAQRLDTYIDIPLEIAVPDFVSDDDMESGGHLVGNFKLVLQSVVCHRGKSVHSGHYISLVRGHAANAIDVTRQSRASSDTTDSSWMLFDDIAKERIRYVDIDKALKEECPYLLFYQVQPIDEDEPLMSGPPSYDEAMSRTDSDPMMDGLDEKIRLPDYTFENADKAATKRTSDTPSIEAKNREFSFGQYTGDSPRLSTEIDPADPRGRTSTSSNRRPSVNLDVDRNSIAVTSGPSTPADESRLDFLKLPSRRGSRQSSRKTKSRPTSVGADSASRFSLNMSRLTTRLSRSDLPAASTTAVAEEPIATQDHDPGAGAVAETSSPVEKPRRKEKQPAAAEERKVRKKGQVPERDCVVM